MVHADFCSKAKVVDVEFFFKCEWTGEKQKGAFVCILCNKVQKVISLSCAQLRGARYSFICCCMPLHHKLSFLHKPSVLLIYSVPSFVFISFTLK